MSILLSLFLTGCKGQVSETPKEMADNGEPKVDVRVEKEYDDDGNLIRYDSTYSYFYSNFADNPVVADSLLNRFKTMLGEQYNFFKDPFFDEFFFQPPTIKDNFYTDDFFQKQFRDHLGQMEKLFMEMDSLKNRFFEEQRQPLLEHKREKM